MFLRKKHQKSINTYHLGAQSFAGNKMKKSTMFGKIVLLGQEYSIFTISDVRITHTRFGII